MGIKIETKNQPECTKISNASELRDSLAVFNGIDKEFERMNRDINRTRYEMFRQLKALEKRLF